MNEGPLGRLGLDDLPLTVFFGHPGLSEAIADGAGLLVIVAALGALLLLSIYRLWRPLWCEWLTSVDHRKIGIMYIAIGLLMLVRGVIEGVLMRINQAAAQGGGFLSPDHFAQLFSTHGTIMIFFVAMPFIVGFINCIVPLQIGARDMAFPVMNQISLAMTAAGASLIMISLVIGQFGTGGWTAYPPYTELAFSPGEGVDYWIWAVVISGLGSLMSGINFSVTIYKLRAPGMTFMRMPMFTWTALCTSILIVFAMPPVTVSSLMLAADRYLDFHFFTNDLGGNMMNYANLFWMFGHPEVYILILPAYGVFSEISATFAAKTLYGYRSLVIATMSIAVLSFTVWLHHFFTMGQGASVNAAFGVATMLIAIPTGVKVYDWMATLWRGRIRMRVPMIYLFGFFMLFTIGGMTGVLLANPTIDFQVHNSLFLVAHFHNVLIPGVLFGMLAGVHYWFPKVFGFRLDARWGARTAWLWIAGFSFAFLPLYALGLMGMPRRASMWDDPAFVPWLIVSGAGALVILLALVALCWTFVTSIRHREALAVPVGDPWDGRTLEWATPSPPPEWNFAIIPSVSARDPFYTEKAAGAFVAATFFGFAMVWHIGWLAAVSALGLVAGVIVLGSRETRHTVIPASDVARAENEWLRELNGAQGVTRDEEITAANRGLAAPDTLPGESRA
ncbi:MAG: cbb3-type cytochrome c oxidase subunit I [Halioglobus sp.]